MRVLLDHPSPFALAHGGFQTQIEQTAAALRSNGVEVEFLRWWDETQRGDVIHYFGRPSEDYVRQARQKGLKIVMAELLTALGSRTRWQRLVQKSLIDLTRAITPKSFTVRMAWNSYQLADAIIALTPWEGQLMHDMFDAPGANIQVVPNGVEEAFLNAAPCPRGQWLVCTATITERKRVLELAQAAAAAQTPLWIIGKPYSSADPYGRRFEQFARSQPEWIRYEGPVQDRSRLAGIYREARGFVLLSTMESLSLSCLEAAACECPLLLSDLPWAQTVFAADASYCPLTSNPARTGARLKSFYENAPRLPTPPKPATWNEVAKQFVALYERLLKTSR